MLFTLVLDEGNWNLLCFNIFIYTPSLCRWDNLKKAKKTVFISKESLNHFYIERSTLISHLALTLLMHDKTLKFKIETQILISYLASLYFLYVMSRPQP